MNEIIRPILVRTIQKRGIPATINSAIEEFLYLNIALSHFLAGRDKEEKIPKLIASVQIYLDELTLIFKSQNVEFNYQRLINQLAKEIETADDPGPIQGRSTSDPFPPGTAV